MPGISKPIPKSLLRRIRKMGKPLGGKAELANLTKLSRPCIKDVLESGRALPATIEKLENALNVSTNNETTTAA